MRAFQLAVFRALGFSKKSAALRVDLLEKLAECERRGINPLPQLDMPSIPIPQIPELHFSIPNPPPIRVPLR